MRLLGRANGRRGEGNRRTYPGRLLWQYWAGEPLGFPSELSPHLVVPGGIPPFDPESYLQSIEKLERLSPKRIFYSHLFGEWHNEDNHLVRAVREGTCAFNRIGGLAGEAGEDDEQIRSHLLDYLRHYWPDAADLGAFMFEPSGYTDYYHKRR